MASENGTVGEERRVVEKVENGGEEVEKGVELVGEEEGEEVVEEKDIEKAESDGEGEEEEEEVGGEDSGKAESEEEEEKGEDKKGVVKKRRGGSSVKEAPITPNGRPSRERKTVERYMEMSNSKSSTGKAVLIEKVLD